MEFMPCFLFIYLCLGSRMLSERVCIERMVNCVLNVYHLWLIHW